MKEIIIEGKLIDSQETLFRQIDERFGFPKYPHTAEGLYSILLLIDEEVEVTIQNLELIEQAVGDDFAELFLAAVEQAAEDNEKLTFLLEECLYIDPMELESNL